MAVDALAHGAAMPAPYSPGNAARGSGGFLSSSGPPRSGSTGIPISRIGRLNRSGQPTEVHYADFHPQGAFPDWLSVIVPVAGSFEPEPETFTWPRNAVYPRNLSAAQYAHLLAAKEAHRVWSAEFYNCIHFIVDMAHAVDLKAPPVMLLSAPTVKLIREMNES
jgi:hypothetical protein